ncbi:Uncharacterised protein [Bordetella pertussis]|nr:Uncharacterised protein [Bordetella pertussis]
MSISAAASSKPMPLGSLTTCAAGTLRAWAYAPSGLWP